ncbi:Na+/H+ antiporter subunit E [Tabrizicola sp.]|jgi:multicomponent K+:H+ antiporter subunit E|uniref:Na+/H+ antiporter subunit E n=1 Tax=Tabrizicola sp. TaxID=2005166 RepID=UPI001A46F090|nr:Na+/H+ antiporter subunit E [Tabrizicola sp.]MBL9062278.1 Na+/H+ antiporter subunit E [Tabrizicola sp.]
MKRLFPHPVLSLALAALWILLVNHWTLGSLVLSLILATLIPLLSARWWPYRPVIRRPLGLIPYTLLVLRDVIVANFQVARIILFLPNDRIRSAWISVPLDLTSPEAISLLAGTITMTPGTLTADVSADGRALLVHSLHAPDPDAIRDEIKTRYESRLKRIFE